jgi:ligand-binding sensor domain-containing protein
MVPLVAFLLALLPVSAYTNPLRAPDSEYTRTLWTHRDGLPTNQILSIAQDRNGFLWLATTAGLIQFDGTRFTLREMLAIRTLCATCRDAVWFAFFNSSRVGTLQNGQITTYDGLPGPVFALLQSRDGKIWAGGRGGLSVFAGNTWKRVEHKFEGPEPTVDGLFEDRRGNLWIGTSAGIYRWSPDSDAFELVLGGPVAAPHVFVETASGEVLVADLSHIVQSLTEAQGSRRFPTFGPAHVQQLLYDSGGALWAATPEHGLLRLHEAGSITRVSTENIVRTLFEDRDRNIWMGTADGLVRLSRSRIISLAAAKRADDRFVRAVLEGDGSGPWLGTSDGVIHISAGGETLFRSAAVGAVTALHRGPDKSLWIGTEAGLLRYTKGQFKAISVNAGQPDSRILSITTDVHGGVWASDLNGLFLWKDGQQTRLKIGGGPAYAAHSDRTGRLWFGFAEGQVAVHGNGQWREYGVRDGLTGAPVVRVWEDDRGVIWVVS